MQLYRLFIVYAISTVTNEALSSKFPTDFQNNNRTLQFTLPDIGSPSYVEKNPLFESANALLSDLSVMFSRSTFELLEERFPEFRSSMFAIEGIPFPGANFLDIFAVQNLLCRDGSVKDAQIYHKIHETDPTSIFLEFVGIGVTCKAQWGYNEENLLIPAVILPTPGEIIFNVKDFSLKLKADIKTLDVNDYSKFEFSLEECGVDIFVETMEATGLLLQFYDAIFDQLQLFLVSWFSDSFCAYIGGPGVKKLREVLLDMVNDLVETSSENNDPLSLQKYEEKSNENTHYINLNDENCEFSTKLNNIVTQANGILGRVVTDETKSSKDSSDLAINEMLRKKLIDSKNKVVIPFDDLHFGPILIFDGETSSPKSEIFLSRVEFEGLDTFREINVLEVIGDQTIKIQFHLNKLNISADGIVKVESTDPSLSSKMVYMSTPKQERNMQLHASLQDLNITASIYLGIDNKMFREMRVSSLLNSRCSLNFLKSFVLTQLSTFFVVPKMPRLSGFFSPGVRDLIWNVTNAVGDIVNLESFGPMVGAVVREVIQNQIEKSIKESSDYCPLHQSNKDSPFLDFRSVFNSSFDLDAGKSTKTDYGDRVPSIMQALRYYELPNDDGSPLINEHIIGRVARLVSNKTGTLFFEPYLGCEAKVDNSEISIIISEVLLQNLDSVGYPLRILEPRVDNPYILDNVISLGKGRDPLQIVTNVDLLLNNEGIESSNKMKISIEVKNLSLIVSILAKVNEAAFLNFPMNDISNLYCWQSLLAGPETGTQNNSSSADIYVDMNNFTLESNEVDITFECLSCENAGLSLITEMLNTLREQGILHIISKGIFTLINEQLQFSEFRESLNQMAKKARYKCPHDPLFEGEDFSLHLPSKLNCLDLPTLPKLSMESIQFASLLVSILVQLSAVIIPISLIPSAYELSDPFWGQATIPTKERDHFVDFRDAKGFGIIFTELLKINHDTANKMVHSFVLDEAGWCSFTFGRTILDKGAIVILESVNIQGLDSLRKFEIFNVVDAQTLQSNISIAKLKVVVNLMLKPIGSSKQKQEKAERFSLLIELQDINITFTLFAALKKKVMHELQLGSLLNVEDFLPCMFSSIHAVNLTQLIVRFDDISHIEVYDVLQNDLSNKINVLSRSIFDGYRSQILPAIPQVTDSFVREFINRRINKFVDDYNGQSCPKSMKQNDGSFIDFRQYFSDVSSGHMSGVNVTCNLICKGINFVRDVFLSPDINGSPLLNRLFVEPFTNFSSHETGVLNYPGVYFSETIYADAILKSTKVKIDASDAKIENLNSFGYPLQLLEPRDDMPYKITNTLTFGAGFKPLKFSTRLSISVENSESLLSNDFIVTLDLTDTSIVTTMLAKLDEHQLLSMVWNEFINPFCWLSTISPRKLNDFGVAEVDDKFLTLSIVDFDISMSKFKLGIKCIDCSSPLIQDFDSRVSSNEGVAQTTNIVLALKDYIVQNPNIKRLIQNFIDRSIQEVPIHCPNKDSPHQSSLESSVGYLPFESVPVGSEARKVFSIVLPCFVIFLVMNLMYYRLQRQKNHKFQELLAQNDCLHQLMMQSIKKDKNEDNYAISSSSLLCHTQIPVFVRYCVPLFVLITILLFLCGHLYVNAVVDVYAYIAGELILIRKVQTVYPFGAVTDMWQVGSKISAIAIFIWSVIWPYVRQVSTLLLWCLPASWLSVDRRSSFLVKLDGLAKWSFCDIYMLFMILVATSIKVGSVNNTVLMPNHFLDVNMVMVLEFGICANMFGQILSQVLAHVIIYYDRKVKKYECGGNLETRSAKRLESELPLEKEKALHEYAFSTDTGQVMKICKYVNIVILIYSMILLSVLMLGIILPTFRYEIQGLVGLGIKFSGDETVRVFDIFSAIGIIMNQGIFVGTVQSYLGLGLMSCLLIFTTLIVGICIIGLLLSVWFIPMKNERRRLLQHWIEIAHTWQYVEVYIFAVFLTLVQISEIAFWLASPFCENFKEMFEMLLYFDVLDEETSACLLLKADFDPGIYFLLLYSVMLNSFSYFVRKAVTQQKDETGRNGKDNTDSELDEFQGGIKDSFDLATVKKEIQFTDMFQYIMYPVQFKPQTFA